MTTFLNELAVGQNLAEQNGNNYVKNAYAWLKTIFLIVNVIACKVAK